MKDNVNHPEHYTQHPSGVECIDITRHYCFSVGNAIKYLWRAGLKKEEGLDDKQKEIEDLNKAMWYIRDRIKQLENEYVTNKFQKPFKDGDILATDLGSVFFLNTLLNTDDRYGCYVGVGGNGSFHICESFVYKGCCGFATEEEKQKLFQAIKDNGYKWNAETKTLEKLIEPKFKVGDIIQYVDDYKVRITEVNIEDECYIYESIIAKGIGSITFSEQNSWELVPNKFDITTLKPFDMVLVRDNNEQLWVADLFGFHDDRMVYKFMCVGHNVNQCIPYNDDTKHLLGTTDDCDEYFKTWE